MKERTWKHCRPGAGTWAGMFLAFVVLLAGRAWAVTPNVTKHTQNEVQDYLMKHAVSTKEHQTYVTDPILDKASQTYIPGELSEQSKKDALQVLNNIRYIAGLNYNVTLDDGYGESAQAGAFVNCAIDKMTHTPKDDSDVVKPDGMPDELWDAGDKGCGSSNLAWNSGTLNRAVFRWTGDEDYKNIFKVGHRRWVLNPTMGKTGFGAVDPYYAMISMDSTASGGQSRVVWPAQEMPVEYFDATFPWTISVGSYINNPDNVKVTLTRTSDGKTWLFDTLSTSSSSDKKSHFYYIDNSTGLAQQGCIIFRPENFEFQAGETYHVKAENVNSQTIEYDVHFFKGFSAETASFAKEKYYALSGVGTYLGNELIVGPGEAEADTIVWESSDPSVFKVDQEGNVTGTGRGSAVLTATVNGALKATCTITVLNVWYSSVAEYAGGDAVPVNVTVTDSETGEELKEGSDYKILYFSAFHSDDPTSPTITEVGESDFFRVLTGGVLPNVNYSFSTRYRVVKKAITDDMVSVTPEEFQYNGSEQKPTVEVKHGNTILKLQQDYEVEFSGGTNAGDYTVTIKGAGKHYTGIVTKEFHITPKKLSSEEITVTSSDNLVYNGEAQLPDIVVTDGEKQLIKDADYELVLNPEGDGETLSINAGDYKYHIKGIGNYTSEIESAFTIHPRKLDEKMVSIADLTYNCQVQDPAVTILDIAEPADGDPDASQESNLITKEDYDLAFFDENGFETEIKDAGKYILTVTGKRNYTGTLNVGFAVSQASMKDIEIEEIEDQIYTSEAIEPAVVLTYQGVSLPQDDYGCKYSDNIHAGTATISIIPRKNRAGHTNFKDETEVKFNILPRSIAGASITLKPDTAVYNGQVQKLTATISVAGEHVDTETTSTAVVYILGTKDYDLAYFDANGNEAELKDAGDYTVRATAKGDFIGTAETTFKITPKPITEDMVDASIEKYVFNGNMQKPSVKVTDPDGDVTLIEGKDYVISLEKRPVNAGDYILTVTGTGNYGSSVDVKFTINPKQLTDSMVKVGALTYNCQAQKPDVTISDIAAPIDGDPDASEGSDLITKEDYDLAFFDENGFETEIKDAAKYTLTVTGKRNYTGTLNVGFAVSQASMKDIEIEEIEDQIYTAEAIEPAVVLTYQGVSIPTDDYCCKYSDNIHAGTAMISIFPRKNRAGHTNFKDEAEVKFNIQPRSIEKATMTLKPDTAVYSGEVQKVDVSVSVEVESSDTQSGDAANILHLGADDYDLVYLGADGTETELKDAGNYSVKATGKGDYAGSVEAAFTITPKPITKEMVDTSIQKYVYNGNVQQPSVEVTDPDTGAVLVEKKDYSISLENKPVNAGDYDLTVIGMGNYGSSVDVKFTIAPRKLTEDMVSVETLTYNCLEQKPDVQVSDKVRDDKTADDAGTGKGADDAGTGKAADDDAAGKVPVGDGAAFDDAARRELITVEDYELTVPTVKDVDTYKVLVKGKRNYTGELEVKFEITPASLKDVAADKINDQTYTGEAITPTISLTYKGTAVPQRDISCKYSDNINVGTALAAITGTKNRAGNKNFIDETEVTFKIVPRDITGASVTVTPDTAVYDGTAKDVKVTVKLNDPAIGAGEGGKILGSDDYDIAYLNAEGEKTELVNAGSYSVKVTAKGNYTGTAEAAFIITPKPISNCAVSIVEENLTYNGESQTPAVKVTDGEQELKEGRDYTVSTEVKAVNAGSYKVIITGIGNYTGETAGGSFTIIPKEITQDMIDDIPQQDADAAEQAEPALVIWLGKTQLEVGKDFTVAYENNTSVGDATAIVTGQGNFTGTARKNFRICRSIAKAVVVPDTLKYTEDGTEKKPGVTVTLGETVLAAGTDYNVSYKNNVKPGTAEVIVTGAGYYMGSASAQFTIEAKPKPVTGGEGGDGVTEPMNPENAPTAEEVEAKVTTMADNAEIPGSGFAILQANAKKIGKNYVKLGWNRVKGAEGYILYGNRCGKSTKMQRIAKLAGGGRTSMKVTKLADGKTKLKKGTYYKFVVVAYARDSLGREKVIASSKSVHFITNGHKKYTNYKGVKVSKSKVSVKKGKTIKITAKAIVPAGKKVSAHRKLKCESADPTAVKVTCNKAGTIIKIKGLKKTSKPVIIYVYAQSGKCAKIKATIN